MALPELSNDQRRAALEKAAKSRKERAELCDKLKKGELSVGKVLSDTDNPIAMRLKVQRLIESLPGYGKARAAKLMNELGISTSRRVQGLGSRQRAELLERLEG
jgi:hypothetical protein